MLFGYLRLWLLRLFGSRVVALMMCLVVYAVRLFAFMVVATIW